MICKSSAAPHAAADWLSCFTGIIRTWPSVARMTPRWKLQCQKKKTHTGLMFTAIEDVT